MSYDHFTKNLKIDNTGGGFKKRSQTVSFFSFILTNFYHFTFGMTVHCTSIKKKLSKNIILMPKFNFELLRTFI